MRKRALASRRTFWPGFRWRILAHHTDEHGFNQGGRVEVRSTDFDCPVEFDELVIDHWFHLEQMDDRDWWMQVGDWHINVRIDAKGKASVRMEENA
jgi:hypothetical protein